MGICFEAAAGPSWHPRNHAARGPAGLLISRPALRGPRLLCCCPSWKRKPGKGCRSSLPGEGLTRRCPRRQRPLRWVEVAGVPLATGVNHCWAAVLSDSAWNFRLLTGSQRLAKWRVCMKLPDLETTGCVVSLCLYNKRGNHGGPLPCPSEAEGPAWCRAVASQDSCFL